MEAPMRPENKLGYLLEHLGGMLSRQADQILQERLGIGLSQFKIMMAIGWNPKVRQRKLAQCLGQTEASVSRQIKLLHEKGMLDALVNPAERRERITEITPKGYKVAEAARTIMGEHLAPKLSQLSDKQVQQLIETLTVLHAQVCQPDNPHACDHPVGI